MPGLRACRAALTLTYGSDSLTGHLSGWESLRNRSRVGWEHRASSVSKAPKDGSSGTELHADAGGDRSDLRDSHLLGGP